MEEKERYTEHTVAWEIPTGDSLTKGNYNLADIETKYIHIQTEMISDDNDYQEEIRQLKQSQNQVAISELEKIYNLFEPYENSQKDTILCANNGISFVDYLENQIKSLKGEE